MSWSQDLTSAGILGSNNTHLAVSRETPGALKRFADTEPLENLFKHVFRVDLTSQPSKGIGGLAQVLVSLKKIDEAERYALEARETVGPHDTISRATTRMALGIVRAAQGRADEAELLLREAVAVVDGKPLLLIRRELVGALARFLRDQGRIGEAEEYEAELGDYDAALAPA